MGFPRRDLREFGERGFLLVVGEADDKADQLLCFLEREGVNRE